MASGVSGRCGTAWRLGTTLLVISSTPLDQWLQIPVGRYNLPVVRVIVAGIVFLAPRSKIVVHALELAPIRCLAVISYGAYLFHLHVLVLIDKLAP